MASKKTIEHGKEVRRKIYDFIIAYIEQHGYPPRAIRVPGYKFVKAGEA